MASINPRNFSDELNVLSLSMEEVVTTFQDKEKRRYLNKSDDAQLEVPVRARSVPASLTTILDSVSYNSNISRAVLTRCLSHYVAAWYDSLPAVQGLTKCFYDVQQKALYHDMANVCRRVSGMSYVFESDWDVQTSFSSVAWVKAKLAGIALPLGAPMYKLFAIGLCAALLASGDDRYTGAILSLKREVDGLLSHIGQRFIEVQSIDRIIEYRLSKMSMETLGEVPN